MSGTHCNRCVYIEPTLAIGNRSRSPNRESEVDGLSIRSSNTDCSTVVGILAKLSVSIWNLGQVFVVVVVVVNLGHCY